MHPLLLPVSSSSTDWLGSFVVSPSVVRVPEYRLYAVEKWIVERIRPLSFLVVYTGNPAHTVSLSARYPDPALSPVDADAQWQQAITKLRADGAKPKQTAHGVLMATSLAHFRSDYTIVHIPSGNFLDVKDQLYTNINLLRLGCSGRTALTLEDPRDSTKDRFLSAYHLPDIPFPPQSSPPISPVRSNSSKTLPSLKPQPKYKDHSAFVATVLEFVKVIQASLSIFGMYQSSIDGLLCDVTVEGIRNWIALIGGPYTGLEPTERIADPMFLSALLSLVLSLRNKLVYLGYAHVLPRDPFLYPYALSLALTTYLQSTTSSAIPAHSYPHTLIVPHLSISHVTHHHPVPPVPIPLSAVTSTASAASTLPVGLVLTPDVLDNINTAYDTKLKSDNRKVRRVLKNKLATGVESDSNIDLIDRDYSRRTAISISTDRPLDRSTNSSIGSSGSHLLTGIGSLASNLRLGTTAAAGTGNGPADLVQPTTDLATFLRTINARESTTGRGRKHHHYKRESLDLGVNTKDALVAGSLKALWSGRVGDIARMRELDADTGTKKHHFGSDRERGSWRRQGLPLSDDELERRSKMRYDGRSTEDENDLHAANSFGGVFSGKVRGKLGSWAGLSRKKGHSVDLTAPTRLFIPPSLVRRSTGSRAQSPTLPPMSFVGEPDDDELLSSGQVSPLSDHRLNPFHMFGGQSSRNTETTNLATLNASNPQESELALAKIMAEKTHKRPWNQRKVSSQGTRVSSWADPVSARDGAEGESGGDASGPEGKKKEDVGPADTEVDSDVSAGLTNTDALAAKWKRKEKARFHSLLSVVDGDGVMGAELLEVDEDSADSLFEGVALRRPTQTRRWSFHDLEEFADVEVLSAERMKTDVELCAQLLILQKRIKHAPYLIATLKRMIESINNTNTLIREHYETHFESLTEIEGGTRILSQIDEEHLKAERSSQATNTLRYESEQFDVPQVWHTASQSRHKVLALREKAFGTGGRRLPPGVHGAHGPFNRLQWTIDGEKRLVDHLGRTESEEEEESRVDPDLLFVTREEEEEDVVEHPGIKPMWLLRFFTGWSARWSAVAAVNPATIMATSPSKEEQLVDGPNAEDVVASPLSNEPATSEKSATSF